LRLLYALTLVASLLPYFAFASALPEGCGEYEVWGRVMRKAGGYLLVVNEKSQSEVQLELPRAAYLRAASHERRYVLARGKISRPVASYRGAFDSAELKDAIPDPLHGTASGFHRITAENCAEK
jgi:hypothetical protein